MDGDIIGRATGRSKGSGKPDVDSFLSNSVADIL